MTEVEIYLDFDKFPSGKQVSNEPLRHLSEKDVEHIRTWIHKKVSGHNEVFAVVTGKASRYVNMVATAELAACGNVVRIGWAQSGMLPIVVKDFRQECVC